MKKWIMAMLFGTVLLLGACGGGGDDGAEESTGGDGGDEVDADAAEEIFDNNCAQCHASDLSGDMGPDLTSVGADYSADEIKDIIQNGQGQMPPQDLDDQDAQTVADWLSEKE